MDTAVSLSSVRAILIIEKIIAVFQQIGSILGQHADCKTDKYDTDSLTQS